MSQPTSECSEPAAMKPGDKVITRAAFASLNMFAPSAFVKTVSEGGTVVLKSALDGRRCFQADELEVILEKEI
jgi:hypothetical protein